MEFFNEDYPAYKFFLHLVSEINDGEYLSSLESNLNNENILFLNPDYVSAKYIIVQIISTYQIILAVHRALYSHHNQKKHSEKLIKEILYFTSTKNKIDQISQLHKIRNEHKSYYILFINMSDVDVNSN